MKHVLSFQAKGTHESNPMYWRRPCANLPELATADHAVLHMQAQGADMISVTPPHLQAWADPAVESLMAAVDAVVHAARRLRNDYNLTRERPKLYIMVFTVADELVICMLLLMRNPMQSLWQSWRVELQLTVMHHLQAIGVRCLLTPGMCKWHARPNQDRSS